MYYIFPIRSILIFALLWLPLFILAQSSQKIVGRVVAKNTGLPLAFAHVSVGGNQVGTLSNESGLFILRIPAHLQEDSLKCNYLGYSSISISLRSHSTDTLFIRLSEQDLELETVEIHSISPKDTIRKAWRNRKLNYEIRPTLLRGYYREEMEDVQSKEKFLFAEGVLELYKSPYHKNPYDRVRILKGRKKKLPNGYAMNGNEYVLPHITQGPHLGLLLDVMKTEDSFVLRSNQKNYVYEFAEVIYLNNRLTYLFTFFPKSFSDIYTIFQGKLWIDLESLAIVRAEYEYSDSGIDLYNQTSPKLKLSSRSFQINYMLYQDRWYLQDARVVNQFHFPVVDRRLKSVHTFFSTEILNDKVNAFSMQETLRLNEAFVEEVQTLEEEFWEEYNVLPVQED